MAPKRTRKFGSLRFYPGWRSWWRPTVTGENTDWGAKIDFKKIFKFTGILPPIFKDVREFKRANFEHLNDPVVNKISSGVKKYRRILMCSFVLGSICATVLIYMRMVMGFE